MFPCRHQQHFDSDESEEEGVEDNIHEDKGVEYQLKDIINFV